MQTKTKSRTQKSPKEFIKDLLDTVPSNRYISKALGVNPQTVSNYRKNLSKIKGGPWSVCPKNTRLFNPKIIEACIIHNCTANISAVDTLEKVYNLAKSKGINHPLPESMKTTFEMAPVISLSKNKFPQLKQNGPDWTPEHISSLENLIGLKGDERKKEANRIANVRGCTANSVLQKFLRMIKTPKFQELWTKKLMFNLNNGIEQKMDLDINSKEKTTRTNRNWTSEEAYKIRSFRPLPINERNEKLKLLGIEISRTYAAMDKKYSNLNIADKKEMTDAKISALNEVRNRIAQATTVQTKPESVNIILNGKEVSFYNNMEYKIENNKMFLVQKETKVIETLTELQ